MDSKDARTGALRKLPKVDEVLSWPEVAPFLAERPRELVVDAIRLALESERTSIRSGNTPKTREGLRGFILDMVRTYSDFHLKPVVNATGVVLHTNLGRAPLSEKALERIVEVARGYSNLEYDLEAGVRGSRYSHVESILKKLTGAESAFVVNNNASAVLLALNTLASGGEVIVSRGEMIEIGGSFRIPEIMKASGATLVEVGTTNKTHLKDYENAITENTRLILKVHPSNYRIVGFTKEVGIEELSELCRERGIPLLYDAGSGALVDFAPKGFADEPSIATSVRLGADVVTFSGDKLLGGPQAGLIVGRAEHVEKMKKNHLNRALRIDKLTLAALEATLRHYLEGDPWETVPTLRMLAEPQAAVMRRARRFAARLAREFPSSLTARAAETTAQSGGGALPATPIPSAGVRITFRTMSCDQVECALRFTNPPVIVLKQDDQVVIDMRTVLPGQEALIVDAFRQIGLTG